MSNFRQVDRETGFLLPPSVDEWLADRHLARLVVAVIEQLDLSSMVKAHRGSGSASCHPSVLPGLVVYGCATGVFWSRKLERATCVTVALRFIAANDHRDHDTIAAFRRRFLDRIEGLFVQVPVPAREAGMLKLGTVALDGTRVHANASRHGALSHESHGHACRIEARLKAEVAELVALAQAACAADVPDGMSVPEGLARRADRLARIGGARATVEARARGRHERGQAGYAGKMKARAGKAKRTGRKPGGRPPQPRMTGPGPRDRGSGQLDRRGNAHHAGGRRQLRAGLQRTGRGGGRQPAGGERRRGPDVVHAANDRQQVEPVLEQPGQLSDALGKAGTLLADSGHFSEANVEACAEARTAPLIAPGSPWGASAIIFPGSSALPHQRRARTTRQPWRRWCIVWRPLKTWSI